MQSLPKFPIFSPNTEYQCCADLNLYDSPTCTGLATQAATGRHLRVISHSEDINYEESISLEINLCEDDYPGWLSIKDVDKIAVAATPYQAIAIPEAEIKKRLPQVIAFALDALKQPNYYLWGGTVGPNYDCSGLMQTAFASVGIWLPRDSYQQEAFSQSVAMSALEPGDLIFFGTPEKVNHVGLYLGEGNYIHSSGREMGRNGIGIDRLSEQGDAISRSYYQRLRSCGRVVRSYESRKQYQIDTDCGIV